VKTYTQDELNSKINTAHQAGQFQALGSVVSLLQSKEDINPRDYTRENFRQEILFRVQKMMAEVR